MVPVRLRTISHADNGCTVRGVCSVLLVLLLPGPGASLRHLPSARATVSNGRQSLASLEHARHEDMKPR